MDTEKDEPTVHHEKQKPEDIFNQGIRSPAGRRSEALASIESVDQYDSAGKSPQRKKRRKTDIGEVDKSKFGIKFTNL